MCSGRPESLLQCHDAASNSIVVYPFKNNLDIGAPLRLPLMQYGVILTADYIKMQPYFVGRYVQPEAP